MGPVQRRADTGEKGREAAHDGGLLHGFPLVVQLQKEEGASTLHISYDCCHPKSPRAGVLSVLLPEA